MTFPGFSSDTVNAIILSTSVFCGVVIVGYIIRGILIRQLSAWADKTISKVDDVIIAAIRHPSVIWILMLAMYITLQFTPLQQRAVTAIEKMLLAAGLLSVTMALSSLLARMIKQQTQKIEGVGSSTSLIQNIVRLIVWGTGIMVILSSLGISVTPILATLGVGGLAVALALQDTLANLFAGVHISLNKIVRVGDYVKLESGEEGYVTDINARTTTLKMLSNNMILVPNSKLTSSIVTNFYYPTKDLAVLIQVSVHYASDLKMVERVTCEVGAEVMKQVPGGVPDFAPFIRYHTFGDSGIGFTVILRGNEYVDQHIIKHEFVKRLHERYAKEGIVIPYPIRAINTTQEAPAKG